jgi:uncharacterized protein DUF2760
MSILVPLLTGAVASAVQFWLLQRVGVVAGTPPALLAGLIAVPFVAAVAAALLRPRAPASQPDVPAAAVEPVPPPEPAEHTALRLLAFLQEEGRLVDFLTEDVAPYSDEQIGAATRGIHATCAKALRQVVTLERVLSGNEDDPVTLESGFDAGAIRLVGNVGGAPPFRGSLRHAGWRATHVAVPARAGIDPFVLAPAEVEIT